MAEPTTNNLTIYLLNCNSINNKIPEIKQILTDNKPDIFCLCETWINKKYVPKFNDYFSVWNHRDTAGGGIGILIQKEFQFKTIYLNIYQNGHLEVQAVELFFTPSNPIKLLTLYISARSKIYHHW